MKPGRFQVRVLVFPQLHKVPWPNWQRRCIQNAVCKGSTPFGTTEWNWTEPYCIRVPRSVDARGQEPSRGNKGSLPEEPGIGSVCLYQRATWLDSTIGSAPPCQGGRWEFKSPSGRVSCIVEPVGYVDPERKRKYQLSWLQARRDKWIAENGPCAQCGSSEQLEVDHVEPRVKSGAPPTRSIWGMAEPQRSRELSKCQVLCKGCHETKSNSERHRTEHGKSRMYGAHGCRCAVCVAWKREYDRERRAHGA